jgi:hypothetical protein
VDPPSRLSRLVQGSWKRLKLYFAVYTVGQHTGSFELPNLTDRMTRKHSVGIVCVVFLNVRAVSRLNTS